MDCCPKCREDIVKAFCEQCETLRLIYDEYLVLFASGGIIEQRRKELMEKVAKFFFQDIQIVLIHYILTKICALTDPSRTGKLENLTVDKVIEVTNASAGAAINALRGRLVEARNKLLAHNDLYAILNEAKHGGFPEGLDVEFFDALQEFVDTVHFAQFDKSFPLSHPNYDGALNVFSAMARAQHFDKIFTGNFSDIEYRDTHEYGDH